MFVPKDSTVPKLQTAKDLQRDALLHYDAEIELMNLILLSIPNDNYNSVDACTSANDMWKRVERPMRETIQNKVDRETHVTNEFDQFVAEPGEALVFLYNQFAQLMNDLERDEMHCPIVTINTNVKGHYARNCPKPRVRDSKYFMEQMLLAKQDEARVILTDEQNNFLFADALRMEEIEDLSANIYDANLLVQNSEVILRICRTYQKQWKLEDPRNFGLSDISSISSKKGSTKQGFLEDPGNFGLCDNACDLLLRKEAPLVSSWEEISRSASSVRVVHISTASFLRGYLDVPKLPTCGHSDACLWISKFAIYVLLVLCGIQTFLKSGDAIRDH
nr:hypothetical protein [Tanacetum cinerariifolium]